MEVMIKTMAHEAGVNQVVTQWPLAAYLETGPKVTTKVMTNLGARPQLPNGILRMELVGPTLSSLSSSSITKQPCSEV